MTLKKRPYQDHSSRDSSPDLPAEPEHLPTQRKIRKTNTEKSSGITKSLESIVKNHSDDELDDSYLNKSHSNIQENVKKRAQDADIKFEHSPALFQLKNKHNLSWDELDIMFEEELWNRMHLTIHLVGEDGSCMFRSVAHQIYGDESFHEEARSQCFDYMSKNSDYYQNFLTSDESIHDYISRKRKPGVFGNHIELQAMSELYNRPIEVYEYSCTPLKCMSTRNSALTDPIRLSYHRKSHFNSLYDPNSPQKIGLGLGFNKIFASTSDLKEAIAKRDIELSNYENKIFGDKVKQTDVETCEDMMISQAISENLAENENTKTEESSKVADFGGDDDVLRHMLELSKQDF